jgi:hypothetical protein
MPSFFTINLNASRNLVRVLTKDKSLAEARRSVKFFLLPQDPMGAIADSMIPDHLVSDRMVNRYLEISPPLASVIPEFQLVIDEIERSYVLGMMFSAVSTSCVAIERVSNLARIQLHKHHTPIKGLWNKGPSKEDAQQLVAAMYYEGGLALPRKLERAKQVAEWVRPMGMRKVENRKRWTSEEDDFVLNHSITESMATLGRSEKSVNLRRWRLLNRFTR